MDLLQKAQQENSPYLQLLMLIGYFCVGGIALVIVSGIILFSAHGTEFLSNPAVLSGLDSKNMWSLQLLLFVSSVALFLVPPVLLAVTEGKKINVFYGFKQPNLKLLGFVVLIMAVSMPVMEWTAVINQKMTLPELLKPVERWMKQKEDEAMQTTLLLLQMKNAKDFLINIFLIALVPAVAEELMFRGGVQRIFSRMFGNPHVAIWLSAFFFSAIHLQFYGFLPRFLLGAGFGYLYLYSGSLWYAMLAHFLNNAYAVSAAWYMQKNNIPLSEADNTMHFAWYGCIISFILTILAFIYFRKITPNNHEQQLG